ncbi:MAG: NUDIX domain-containing protein [Actinobacteria bacterium]|nr:NUDIX domain-containing protein [Actinomycetota bacterium]
MSDLLVIGVQGHGGQVIKRAAVKGVIRSGEGLLMIHSPTIGDYKFPGGGRRDGETDELALAREVGEECGRALNGFGELLVTVVEHRQDAFEPGARFEMESRYYACTVSDRRGDLVLDEYEATLGLTPVTVPADIALRANEAVMRTDHPPAWTARETQVLRWLTEGGLVR